MSNCSVGKQGGFFSFSGPSGVQTYTTWELEEFWFSNAMLWGMQHTTVDFHKVEWPQRHLVWRIRSEKKFLHLGRTRKALETYIWLCSAAERKLQHLYTQKRLVTSTNAQQISNHIKGEWNFFLWNRLWSWEYITWFSAWATLRLHVFLDTWGVLPRKVGGFTAGWITTSTKYF